MTKKSMLDQTFLTIDLAPPNLPSSRVLTPTCPVIDPFDYNFGLADDPTIIFFDCSEAGSGAILPPTNPFTQFNGVEANGVWNLTITPEYSGSINSFSIDYCLAGAAGSSSCNFGQDIARSNTNLPGYRYDSDNGIVYYTSVIRNQQGEELYATISRSMEVIVYANVNKCKAELENIVISFILGGLAPDMLLFTFLPLVVGRYCNTAIENIVAAPRSHREDYLRFLSSELVEFSEILFTSQANAIVTAFEQKYGVIVTLQSPFITCSPLGSMVSCYSLEEAPARPIALGPFPFTIPQSGKLVNISISSMTGSLLEGKKSLLAQDFFSLYLTPPNGSSAPVLVPTCRIPTNVNFDVGFSDASEIPFDCTNVSSGIIFQPTTPLSQFNGLEAQGDWILDVEAIDNDGALNTFTINYCLPNQNGATSGCPYSSDIARSNLNFPGYRYDNGTEYYTIIIRNNQGEEIYVTINGSVQ